MSQRMSTIYSQNLSKVAPKSTRLKNGVNKVILKDSARTIAEQQPVSNTARGIAYDKIKRLEAIEQKSKKTYGASNYNQIFEEFKFIVKDDIEIIGIFPQDWKTQNGRALLANGRFYVAFAKIILYNPYLSKKLYFQTLRQKYLPKATEYTKNFIEFLNLQQEKLRNQKEQEKKKFIQMEVSRLKRINQEKSNRKPKKQEASVSVQYPDLNEEQIKKEIALKDFATMTSLAKEKPIRKSCLKPANQGRKSVHWSQFSQNQETPYINGFIQANKEYTQKQRIQEQQKQRNQKISKIRSMNSFLIDFFQINDIYLEDMVEIKGIIDQIDDKYAIVLIKQKSSIPQPSYVKTRKSHTQEIQHRKQTKQKKQILAIGLLKSIGILDHKIETLKKIQKDYPNIVCFLDIEDTASLFLSALDNQSVEKQSQ